MIAAATTDKEIQKLTKFSEPSKSLINVIFKVLVSVEVFTNCMSKEIFEDGLMTKWLS